MNTGIYYCDCKGCDISQGFKETTGGIIELEGNWILNHYGGGEGFLGWMALQPKYHRMEFSELNNKEIDYLGRNIQEIETALCSYWSVKFNNDPIERMYVTYFFESPFDKERPKEESNCKHVNYHLHIHLIIRTREIGRILRKKRYCTAPNINAWMIHTIIKDSEFPSKYKRNDKEVIGLMTYLRSVLIDE